jgi:hypothetical protein
VTEVRHIAPARREGKAPGSKQLPGALLVLLYLRRFSEEPPRHGIKGHRLFLTFAASSACASANVRTIAAASAANALGVAA